MKGRLTSEQGGWTLIELLVASSIAIALLGITVTMFTSLLGSEPRASSRSVQIEDGRVMLERITRELRQGTSADVDDTLDRITLQTEVCEDSTVESCVVAYECLDGTCTRAEGQEGAMPAGSQVVSGLDPGQRVFLEDVAAPSFYELILSYPYEGGQEAVTLSDGVAIRNYSEPEEET